MAEESDDWVVPSSARAKPHDCAYDLERALGAIVALTARIPADAHTAEALGTERGGSAVAIGPDNLLLTMGYLIVEAAEIWLTTRAQRVIPAHVVGYDHVTGFGLIQAQGPLDGPVLSLGNSREARPGDRVVFAAAGGMRGALAAHVVARQQFAGYWEYLLDDAIFTAPAHPNWGGAALISPAGELWGVGSLQVPHQLQGDLMVPLNMSVPTEALLPILDDLKTLGRSVRAPRPWLGLFAAESGAGGIAVLGLAGDGPARRAGLREGDIILAVDGHEVDRLADFFQAVWSLGAPGIEVPLRIDREGDIFDVRIKSADRYRFLKKASLH